MSVRLIQIPPDTGDGASDSVTDAVKREIKKARRKDRKKEDRDSRTLEELGDIGVLSAISQSQQAILSILVNPPVNTSTGLIVTGLQNPPAYGYDEMGALKWAVNGVAKMAVATYNAISALRAEVLIAFLDHGLNPRSRHGGLLGGGVAGLLILVTLGSGYGFSSLFSGSAPIPQQATGPIFGGLG